ncbi:MAG: hypothetical protein LIP01_04755 [Tannerellaceae bacterium]|nr:hypothetical protein [Tannerellaceae bacterium]
MKKIISLLCVLAVLCGTFASPAYAMENDNSAPAAEVLSADEFAAGMESATINYLTDKTRGTKKPSTSDKWDIYLQDYVFNMDFSTALYTNYNFTNHGGEIKVVVTCTSSNPKNIKMELYRAGETTCRTTMELNPNGTTYGRFYNLDLKTNYYFKFVSEDGYSVRGEGRLYLEPDNG